MYTREARGLCSTLRVSETEFLLHIDHEKIKNDSKAYLAFNTDTSGNIPTDITRGLIEKLISENAAGRAAIERQEAQMNTLLEGFGKLVKGL